MDLPLLPFFLWCRWEHVLNDMGSLDAYKVSQSMEMEMYPRLYWLQRSFDLIPVVIFWLLCEEPDRKKAC